MDKKRICENLKLARAKAGMTQKQVGDAVGVPDSTIRKYESGRLTPKIETIERLSVAIGISPFQILEGVFDKGGEPPNC